MKDQHTCKIVSSRAILSPGYRAVDIVSIVGPWLGRGERGAIEEDHPLPAPHRVIIEAAMQPMTYEQEDDCFSIMLLTKARPSNCLKVQ